MPVRSIVDIPELLHKVLRDTARRSGVSVESRIVHAIEQTYATRKNGAYVTGPLVFLAAESGPDFPTDENPHHFVFS
jgi:hypothetical protein